MTDLNLQVRRERAHTAHKPGQPQGVHTAVVTRVSDAGEVFVRIPTQDARVEYGPLIAPEDFSPYVGIECLIAITPEPGGHWYVAPLPSGGGGGGSGDLSYVHTQGTPSATWTVAHGLGKYPAVDVVDTGDSVVIPNVVYLDINTIRLDFGSPTSGKAFVN